MTIDHYAIEPRVRLNRACKEPGPCPDLEAAYLDLYDEVMRLRADREQGGLDYCDLMKRHDAHFVAWQSAKSRAEKSEAELRRMQGDAPSADPVRLDPSGEAALAAMRAIKGQQRFEAAKAVLAGVAEVNPNLPGDPASMSGWPDPETLAARRAKWAVMQADALLAALGASHAE